MKFNAKFAGALVGAMTFSGAAFALIVTPPDERVGIDLATPLPEGVYFVDLGGVGSWRAQPTQNSGFDYNVPIVAWSTPWTILGGRFQFIAATPEISLTAPSHGADPGTYLNGWYNPFVAGQIAWSLGNGFAISYLAGAYIQVSGPQEHGINSNALDQTTFHQMLAVAWHGNDWNVTSNVQYGLNGPNNAYTGALAQNSDYLNYNLGVTHTFGKWEIGPIGYGSVNFENTYHGVILAPEQDQIALGGLVGYNFGPVIMQFILAHDVWTINYPQQATTFTGHLVVPAWTPEAPKAVVAKY